MEEVYALEESRVVVIIHQFERACMGGGGLVLSMIVMRSVERANVRQAGYGGEGKRGEKTSD